MPSLTSALIALTTLLALTSAAPTSPLAMAEAIDTRALGDLQSSLFPLGNYPSTSSWTTSTALNTRYTLTSALPITKGKKPQSATSPTGQNAFLAFFPQGSINPGNAAAPRGGFSFYSTGPTWGASLNKGDSSQTFQQNLYQAKEIVFGYSVFFQDGFQFQKGGKLPGVFGGDSLEDGVSCSGGRQDGRDGCFSVRMMWRADGAGEAYDYLPNSVSQPPSYCTTPPYSTCDAAYGDSIGRGAFYFQAGSWTTIAQRVKLNDVGQSNGEIEIFVNGESKIKVTGITIRTRASTAFQGIQAQTFFGGHTSEWASPQDQSAWFKDWSMSIIS